MTFEQIPELLHSEEKPALGCTEPIAVSLAVARACALFPDQMPYKVRAEVSINILQSSLEADTHLDLDMAAALAVVKCDWEKGLEVLSDVTPIDVRLAKELIENGVIEVAMSQTTKLLYIKVEALFPSDHKAVAIIADAHDKFTYVEADGVSIPLE